MHMHQLETLYQCYEVNGQSGVIWGHRGRKVKLVKNDINHIFFIS